MSRVASTCLLLLASALTHAAFGMEARELFKLVDPSVVVVRASTFSEWRQGSGVILGPLDVITNCHVVEGARKIVVNKGNVERNASIRFQDTARDLCQTKLDDMLPEGRPVVGSVMHYVVESPVFAAQTVEPYELTFFQSNP